MRELAGLVMTSCRLRWVETTVIAVHNPFVRRRNDNDSDCSGREMSFDRPVRPARALMVHGSR
jgi:hypothetical protein